MLLVDVCVNIPVRQLSSVYTYCLPEEFSAVDAGWRVEIPFAGQSVEGFVIKKYSGQYTAGDLKSVVAVLDEEPWFDDNMLATARWLSEYYLCTLAEAMRLFLPGKKSISTRIVYRLNDTVPAEGKNGDEDIVLSLLETTDTVTIAQINKAVGKNSEAMVRSLVRRGLLLVEKSTQKKFKRLVELHARLTDKAQEYFQQTAKIPAARKNALSLLLANPAGLSLSYLSKKGISRDTIKRMQLLDLVQIQQQHVVRNSYAKLVTCSQELELTQEQLVATEAISKSIDEKKSELFLLQGITGSGKTQVYFEAAQKIFKNGGQVLVLVPEIALTGQIIRYFKAHFEQHVLVVHSRLSVNERMDVFEFVKTGAPCVVIGARSAVFAPFSNLGIIIIDEEHEASYKQEERPSYHARTVAAWLADYNKIPLVLGSATPDLESYYRAQKGEYRLLRLMQRPDEAELPLVTIVDMKKELEKGNRGVLSEKLLSELQNILDKQEQGIILLNRRGFSTFVLCRDCGYSVKCEHCAVAMVYHQTDNFMRCHYCGYTLPVPDECPACKSRRIKFFGTGTQKAQLQLKENLPSLRIIRMDQDTTSKKFSHDEILTSFKKGEYDILLGTQMVAKGHDVPNVTLVGVLAADSLLNLPDFRAAERTFSLLAQAAGRAGRGDKKGLVVLQAYETEHPALNYVIKHDYDGFALHELKEREELFYPPFSSIIKITVVGKDEQVALSKAGKIVDKLNGEDFTGKSQVEINGPFQGTVTKVKDLHKFIIIIKTDLPEQLKEWFKENGILDAKDTLIDIDPLSVI